MSINAFAYRPFGIIRKPWVSTNLHLGCGRALASFWHWTFRNLPFGTMRGHWLKTALKLERLTSGEFARLTGSLQCIVNACFFAFIAVTSLMHFIVLHSWSAIGLAAGDVIVVIKTTSNRQTRQLSETVGHQLGWRFSWKSHIEAIASKATQRLYFLKQLRRAGVPQAQLLHFYTAVIRLVLEYAALVWNHLLTKTQIDQIEAIQRRALRIIYSYTSDMSYTAHFIVLLFPVLQTAENTSHENF